MALPPDKTSPSNNKAAAQQAAQQDVFLREVDDALRQDQVEGFMKRYGVMLGIVIVIGLAGFGGWLYWNHHQTKQLEERTETFVTALDSVQANNLDDARAKLKPLADDGSDANATSARLLLAAIALEQDKKGDALKLYKQVAADTQAPQPLRDLATVREVAADFDAMKPQDVVSRLKPLAAPGNPWFGVAGEMVGMAYLKMDKKDQAGPLFAAIAKDESVDDALRSRARQLAAVLGVDAVDAVVDDKGEPLDKPVGKLIKAAEAGGE
ncbi:tetratricopeptide repeat protein [Novosphingobium mangrovi (ex Huang et al. 2023)]|uniref:Ancillary SecYEG translocon subunit n=1 Tax=Novosphingobium mangrovi (ex Huang et al. 2023) TaxID=2976432 RepID=A0ABT2I0D2_9SPHN|nr:tetratricopeptide repeat protein [Novosphingobium mangrovi (ex Huang et al. 2023)]MCT2398257.1 tetratricopeptide repeat protein [Novosphingobium mangrovi (ex Huang et al. 2023)]